MLWSPNIFYTKHYCATRPTLDTDTSTGIPSNSKQPHTTSNSPVPHPLESHQDELFGFLVPYFDRDVIRFPTPSYNAAPPPISPVLLFLSPIKHIPLDLEATYVKNGEKIPSHIIDPPLPQLRFPKKRRERRGKWLRKTYQIVGASDEVVSHTRAVLTSATAHKNNAVLLHIMTYIRKLRQKVSALNSLSSPTSYPPLFPHLLFSQFRANPAQHSIQTKHHSLSLLPPRSQKSK